MYLSVKNISKSYNNRKVLDIEEINIAPSEIVGIVGNNGAGKTTLFRSILDLIKYESGTILVNGINHLASESWKLFIGSYLDQSTLLKFLTPEEFFEFIGFLYKMPKVLLESEIERYEDFFSNEVLDKDGKLIRDFSSGNIQKIGIVSALIGSAPLIILDEPFNSLDPTSQIKLKKLITENHHSKAQSFLISSHDINHIVDICTRIILVEKGMILRDIVGGEGARQVLNEYFYNSQ